MRYEEGRKDETRERIVKEAAKRFRAEGIDGVGVANLMSSVGLTHGGFYAHFKNKDELVAEACTSAYGDIFRRMRAAIELAPKGEKLRTYTRISLSKSHRDHPEAGCFAAALAGEIVRKPTTIRSELTTQLKLMVEFIQECIQLDELQVSAEAVLSIIIGAVTLSRSVNDEELSKVFLSASTAAIDSLIANNRH